MYLVTKEKNIRLLKIKLIFKFDIIFAKNEAEGEMNWLWLGHKMANLFFLAVFYSLSLS